MQRLEIEQCEQEAVKLEQMEIDLLNRLQETQRREKDTYAKLESVMLDSAIPKKHRIH